MPFVSTSDPSVVCLIKVFKRPSYRFLIERAILSNDHADKNPEEFGESLWDVLRRDNKACPGRGVCETEVVTKATTESADSADSADEENEELSMQPFCSCLLLTATCFEICEICGICGCLSRRTLR